MNIYEMPEDRGPESLDARVRSLMLDLGLWGYHPHNTFRDTRGWPDWVIIGAAGILFRELKSQRGTLSPDQRGVGRMLIVVGLDWSVWRPSDLANGTIARQLAAIAGMEKAA